MSGRYDLLVRGGTVIDGARAPRYAADVALRDGEIAAIAKLLPAGAVYFAMDEKDVQRILAFESTMIGSDGLPHDAAPIPVSGEPFHACSGTIAAAWASSRSKPRCTK